MSKAQKTIIAITLLIIVLILLFPATYYYTGERRLREDIEFLFTKGGERTIDMQGTINKSFVVILVGGILVILLGQKKKK